MGGVTNIIDFLRKKFSDFELIPKIKGIELQPLYNRDMEKVFEDLDKDDDLNEEARDFLIGEIEKVMRRKVDFQNTLEFRDQLISCKVLGDSVNLSWMTPVGDKHSMPVWFDGDKPYPLSVWLKEQILTNIDVIELEKGLIKML